MRALAVLLLLAACLVPAAVQAQRRRGGLREQMGGDPGLERFRSNRVTPLYAGVAAGAGAGQLWLGATGDLHYGPLVLRLHPGLWYYGAGLQYFFGPTVWARDCNHRPVYLGLYYQNDWLLSNTAPNDPSITDRTVTSLVLGARHKLDYLGRVYAEAGLGVGTAQVTRTQPDASTSQRRNWFPMGELRIGIRFQGKPLLPRPPRGR